MKIKNVTWALVTGASGGIGREYALILAAHKISLVLVARNAERLDLVAAEARAADAPTVKTIASDLSAEGSAQKIFNELEQEGIVIDLLINNAGAGLMGEAVELPLERTLSMIKLNIDALVALSTIFGHAMKKRGAGKILNIASMVALMPVPYYAAYSASKHFVLAYSLALRAELKPYGVQVNCSLPGYTRTNFDESAGITSKAYRKFSDVNALPPHRVAERGLKTLCKNRGWETVGKTNKLSAFFVGLVPRTLLANSMKNFIDKLIARG